MGAPHLVVHNVVRATFNVFLDAEPEELESNFRVNATSLLYLAVKNDKRPALGLQSSAISRPN